MMRIAFSTFWLQKAGNQTEEYEDAYSPSAVDEGEYPEFLCAVADGATETSYSGLWAQILVDAFVNKRLNRVSKEIVDGLSDIWQAQIAERTREKPLSWYAEEKLRNGAYSSLMGLHLKEDGRWNAVCVGDSCLFRLRSPNDIKSFPYGDPAQFNNHPILISTNARNNAQVISSSAYGKWKEGDCFLLMTDALAHYFMSHKEARSKIVPTMLDQEQFVSLIGEARQAKNCRNDDVTLLKVYIKPGVRDGDVA